MSSPFSPGNLVAGRYRIAREIGRGGMATVYIARDETHQRDVAVKVLTREVTGELGADRFLAEIRTTAGLSHPHILPLLDSGREGDALYYVTPFVRGESLKERLRSRGPLSVDEALRIGAELAAALAHAHGEGVVHRDVKPGNILLDPSGNAYLADFGIARALSTTGDALRTSSGYVLGTIQYMSPEQISGERELDGSADVYSLACVIYEMLAGEPAFRASSAQATAAAHLVRPAPSVGHARPEAPPELDRILAHALAKNPADRMATAAELSARLDDLRTTARGVSGVPAWPGRPGWLQSRVLYPGAAALLVVALALGLRGVFGNAPPGPGLDTTRYAVLPFEHDPSLGEGVPIQFLFQDALGHWEGITVVDGLRIRDLAARAADPGRLTWEEAAELADSVNAGRIVTGQATRVGDSIRVEALLLDANTSGDRLQRAVFMLAADRTDAAPVSRAAETLLFGSSSGRLGVNGVGTRSAAAMREYGLGQAALARWELAETEAYFTEAARLDPYFDLALLWNAQVMSWQGRLVREWEADARRAAQGADGLPPRERLLARALVAMVEERHPEACSLYEELLRREPGDFAALFGLGECRRRDARVLPDSDSPTGWAFRASGSAAAGWYRRALESLPTSYRAFGAASFDRARLLLYAVRGDLRQGRGPPPESRLFVGFPVWRGDSLAFDPVPVEQLPIEIDLAATDEALVHQRRALVDVANTWVRAFPQSGEALYTLAMARELVSDPSSLGLYAEARRLSTDPQTSLRAGAAEVALRVRLSLPDDLEGLRAAAALGDSLLSEPVENVTDVAEPLAEIAALLGRPNTAARLRRAASVGEGLGQLPGEVMRESGALLAFAAVGAPIDSLRTLEGRVEQAIVRLVPAADVASARQAVLEQPSFLAFPGHRMAFLEAPDLPRSPEARAIALLSTAGGEAAVRALGDTPPSMTWDSRLARANLLVAAGRERDASALLSEGFGSLATSDPAYVVSLASLGALVRAAALMAELEQTHGSAESAERWARAVTVLWEDGEPSVGSMVSRMTRIVEALP